MEIRDNIRRYYEKNDKNNSIKVPKISPGFEMHTKKKEKST